jgi:hypothetical protein
MQDLNNIQSTSKSSLSRQSHAWSQNADRMSWNTVTLKARRCLQVPRDKVQAVAEAATSRITEPHGMGTCAEVAKPLMLHSKGYAVKRGELSCAAVVRGVCYLRYDRPVLEEFLNCVENEKKEAAEDRANEIALSPLPEKKKSPNHAKKGRKTATHAERVDMKVSFICATKCFAVLLHVLCSDCPPSEL